MKTELEFAKKYLSLFKRGLICNGDDLEVAQPLADEAKALIERAESAQHERKIVQICGDSYRHALCNDGSVWMLRIAGSSLSWQRLPPIPQGDAP